MKSARPMLVVAGLLQVVTLVLLVRNVLALREINREACQYLSMRPQPTEIVDSCARYGVSVELKP